MNLLDWLILILVAAALFFAFRRLRSGKTCGCSDGCSKCGCRCSERKNKQV